MMHRSKDAHSALFLALLMLFPFDASAYQDRGNSRRLRLTSPTSVDSGPIKVRIEAQTILPYLVGGVIALDAPGGLQIRSSLGSTPDLFIDAIQSALSSSVPAFDNGLADTLFDRTDGPVGWRLEFGWKPELLRGFFANVGYGFLFLAGRFSPDDATEQLRSQFVGTTPNTVADITSTMHAITTEVGFEFEPSDVWVVRLAVGGLFTFHSSASINVRAVDNPQSENLEVNIAETEESIRRALRTYGHIPTLSISVGIRTL
jgi:hypothetical protein